MLPELVRSRAQRVAALIVGVLLGGVGFLPLFGGPGYEAALAAGLVLPATAAIATALEIAARRVDPVAAVERGAASGALLALIGLAVTLLHGARAGFCDPVEGLELFVLGPGAGSVLGGVCGAFAGLLAERVERRRRRVVVAVLLALAAPAGGVVVSLLRFWSSPMVFAFDPFFGYFAGALYDTVIDATWNLLTYRVGTLCTLIALWALAAHLSRAGDSNSLVLRMPVRRGITLVGLVALGASIAHCAEGPALGHWSTPASIQKALGRELATKRCDVVYDKSILGRDAALLGRECDAHVAQIERWLGTRGPARIRVFLFASSGEKKRLMGASDTYIAKPWRKEIYIQVALYPHPVLAHELAHVIAGSFGAGPFRVSGPLDGIVPDPGRIEGVATAAAPPEDSDLTLGEWARTMQKLDLLPPLDRVFRLGFLGENSSTAYTVAGAFVRWFHDAYGANALRAWYGAGTLPKPLPALETEWHVALSKISVSDQALVAAKARFERPAIFGRRCPHVVDRLAGEAGSALGDHDVKGAQDDYRELLELDPHDFGARLGLATCALRGGDAADARRRYDALVRDPDLTRLLRAVAEEALGDLDLQQGKTARADAHYREIAKSVLDEDRLRTLDVKRASSSDLARGAIVALLVGTPRLGPDWAEAAARLQAWSDADPDDGTADYLLGRNFYNHGRWDEARVHLDAALRRRLALPRVEREALRTRLVLACAMNDVETATAVYARWRASPDIDAARRAGVASLAERCGITP